MEYKNIGSTNPNKYARIFRLMRDPDLPKSVIDREKESLPPDAQIDLENLLFDSTNAIESFINGCEIDKSLTILRDLVMSEIFNIREIDFPLEFIETLERCLTCDYVIDDNTLIILLSFLLNLLIHIEDTRSPFTDEVIITSIVALLRHDNEVVVSKSLKILINYCFISSEIAYFLLSIDVIEHILRFLPPDQSEHSLEALKLITEITYYDISEYIISFLQIIPYLKLFLTNPDFLFRKCSTLCLITFLSNPHSYQYVIAQEIHYSIIQNAQSLIDQDFGYFIFKALYIIASKGYFRIFRFESFITGFEAILYQIGKNEYNNNISSLFLTAALISSMHWEMFISQTIVNATINYALLGSFENRESATLLLARLIIFSHPQYKDMIANNGGFEAIWAIIESMHDFELEICLEAISVLFSLNFNLYRSMCDDNNALAIFDQIDVPQSGRASDLYEIVHEQLIIQLELPPH